MGHTQEITCRLQLNQYWMIFASVAWLKNKAVRSSLYTTFLSLYHKLHTQPGGLEFIFPITTLAEVSFTFGKICVSGLWSISLLALATSSENSSHAKVQNCRFNCLHVSWPQYCCPLLKVLMFKYRQQMSLNSHDKYTYQDYMFQVLM